MAFPHREPTIATTVRLPQSVYYEARVLLADPRTGELKYDSWAPLIARLLRAWIDEQKIADPNAEDKTNSLPARNHDAERGIHSLDPSLDPFVKTGDRH